MKVTLPYPPTVNTYYRHDRGRTHISTKGKAYRKEVWALCLSQQVKEMQGRIKAEFAVYFPDKRRRDLDNLMKCMLDSLQHGGAFKDDTQVKDFHIYEAGFDKPGRVEVELKAM